jgi:hypothetical protein
VAVFSWGIGFYGPSVFLHVLHSQRRWPVSAISAAITAHYLVSAAIVVRLPELHRRFGMAAMTRAATGATDVGLLGWAFAAASWQLFAAAILTGAGFAATVLTGREMLNHLPGGSRPPDEAEHNINT